MTKRKGNYKGRQPKKIPVDFETYYNKWKNKEITGTEFCKILGYSSRGSMYKMVERYEKKKGIRK